MSDTALPATIPAPQPAPFAPAGSLAERARGFMRQPAVSRALPMIGAAGLVGVAALGWAMLSSPPQRALAPAASEQDKAAIADALTAGGIAHAIDRTTGAITVGEDDYHRARMAIASQGLPRGGESASDVIAGLPMGASRAVEGERLRSAREADLARTIEAIDGIESVRVHLALSEPSAFVRARRQAAASVMVTLANGRSLSDEQARAIVHLVASSVPELTAEAVSIVDQRGRLLSANAGGASERQLALRRAVEDDYRRAVASLLTPLVGAENFTAEVNADLDFGEVQSTREGFPQDARALSAEQGESSSDGAAERAGGIPGALANQPPAPPVLTPSPPAELTQPMQQDMTGQAGAGRRSENYSRRFAVGREISVTRQQSPALRRLSVAVVLRNAPGARARSDMELREIERLVKGAVGFDEARGDMVAVGARPFAAAPEKEAAPWWEGDWFMALARQIGAALIVALLVFGIGRPLLRRLPGGRREAAETPATSAAAAAAAAGAAAAATPDGGSRPVTIDMIEASPGYENRAALIRDFVRQDPDRAALVVRDLIREGETRKHD